MADIPFENRNKYGGEIDWDGGADEFVAAVTGEPAVGSRRGGSGGASASPAAEVDEDIFREAGSADRYLGK